MNFQHRVADYATICQGLAGTYLDIRLSEEARLDQLVEAVAQNLTELTRQLVNNAVSFALNPRQLLAISRSIKLRNVFTNHKMHAIADCLRKQPAINRLGLPAYNYLNDDEHGVIGTSSATVFPMGVGMGASWSSEMVHLVGEAIGVEAR